jgi:spermidine synthase
VLGLVAVPVALLGTVAPFANRLAVDRLTATGTVTGHLYAISTIGSLVGTFASALLMIPLIGTHRTFLVFSLALVAVAAPGLRPRLVLLVPLLVGGLLALPVAGSGTAVAGARVIYSAETPYQYVRVLALPSGERWLELNEGVAIHSDYRPWTYLTGGYWDDFLALPELVGRSVPQRVAILGDAAGTVARAYGHYFPRTRVDAVELDGQLTEIGRRFFDLHGPNLHFYSADARPWLAARHSRYDAIFLDAYRQPYIPFYLVTREFFASVAAHLRPGGVVVVNVGHPSGSDALEKVVTATLGADFEAAIRDRVSTTNSLVIASRQPLRSPRAEELPPELGPLAAAVQARLERTLTGGAVYTDDRAPVEWLTDLSLLRYAAGDR